MAGLLALSVQIHNTVSKYIDTAKNARVEAHNLAAKIAAIIAVLEQLERFIRDQHVTGHFSNSSVLYCTTKQCDTSLRDLNVILSRCASTTGADSMRWDGWLTWPLMKERHQQTISVLHEYLEVFNLSMSIDGW